MRVFKFSRERAQPIELFESLRAASVYLGDGSGETHVYCIYLEPGGFVGRHPTGFAQLFLVVEGMAWAAGEEGRRVNLSAGEGAYFDAGEMHAKGSDGGATAIMVQVAELAMKAPALGL